MQYGVCGNHETAGVAKQAGFDYMEYSVGNLLKPMEEQAVFLSAFSQAKTGGLPVEACNGFIPGELKITGPDVNLAALETYVTTACERARETGIGVIVFGSGGARQVPDGFDRDQAHAQIVSFCRMLAPIAQQHDVIIAVEPLNRPECNVLNTVSECAALVREVNHPALRLLVDSYHLMKDNDSYEDIVVNGDLLAHVHIGTVPNRVSPGAEPCDLYPFFEALVRAGYNGRISIEAGIPDPAVNLPQAFALMNQLEQKVKIKKV